MHNKYVLNSNSASYLKRDCQVAITSIRIDVTSADYVDWEYMNGQEYDDLIQEVIDNDYLLSINSCETLSKNFDVVMHSIKSNMDTIMYADHSLQDNPLIIKYLIKKGYDYKEYELREMSISVLFDKEIMEYVLNKLISFEDDYFSKEFNEKIVELFVKALNAFPKISNYKSRLQYVAERLWEEKREDNINDYANIFGKICTELNKSDNFNFAIGSLPFLSKMQEALEDKFELLIKAMKEYHTIYHSGSKLDDIANSRNQISDLSALYISISKEKYKKKVATDFYDSLKLYFMPKKTNPIIQKRVLEYQQKQKFRRLFQKGNQEIYRFIDNIVDEFGKSFNKDLIYNMIESFLVDDCTRLDCFIKAPRGFNNYLRYKEASKLVNRLNSNYIKHTDLEVKNFLDIIQCDNSKKRYYYSGPLFTNKDIDIFNEYIEKQKLFEKIKQRIILKIKELSINDEITREELNDIARDFPFNDDYYEFDTTIFDEIDVGNFLNACFSDEVYVKNELFLDDKIYSFIEKFLINNNLIWLMLIDYIFESDIDKIYYDDLDKIYYDDLDKEVLFNLINNTKEIVRLAAFFNYDLNVYENVMKLSELSECASEESIAILGKNIISELCENRQYTNDNAKEIIEMAKSLVCQMVKRDKSTVPYISGKLGNYKYCMYDSQDVDILLSGINTNSCFRIDGNDHDFLHYCVLDKNGFVIKIVNEYDNFIAKASGFRNGNGVYINQLRTIYDSGGYGYEGNSESEKKAIIETFKKACRDIVEISQNNPFEHDKIDFVLVTSSYALENEESNVSVEVENKIGDTPMDNKSSDWFDFIHNTANLQEIFDGGDVFSTDYGKYSLICVASSKEININNNTKLPIKRKNVPALYSRKRSMIVIGNPDENHIDKINRIKGIFCSLNKISYKNVLFPPKSVVIIGDNWYIVYNNKSIIDACVLEFDKNALIEYENTIKILENKLSLDNNYSKKLFLSRK